MTFDLPLWCGRVLMPAAAMMVSLAVVPGATLAAEDFGPVAPLKFDAKKAELGKRLFYDVRLSGDSAISCAPCHNPEKGCADGLPLSKAYPGSEGFRNTPTLINTAAKNIWHHDGRQGTNLNDVTRGMLTETCLMSRDMRIMQERAKQDPDYVRMFKEAGYMREHGATVAGPELARTRRIEAGRPEFGIEMDTAYLPLEASLHDAISFDKGCYIGQEYVVRLAHRRHLERWPRGPGEVASIEHLKRGGAPLDREASIASGAAMGRQKE